MTPLEQEILQVINQIVPTIEKAFFDVFVLRHPGHANQKTHGNRYGGYGVTKESLRRLKDDKLEREKYKNRARKKQGAKPKQKTEKPKAPAGTPVSRAIDTSKLPKGGKTGPAVREALGAIDSVHGDGSLLPIPIKTDSATSRYGVYKSSWSGQPVAIQVSTKGPHPMMTTAHEVGHYLDHQGLRTRQRDWASMENIPEMRAVLDAAGKSKALNEMAGLRGKKVTVQTPSGRDFSYTADGKFINYTLNKKEVFARAYSQYIAQKSGNKQMISELNDMRKRPEGNGIYYPTQWDDNDFAPISKAMDSLFESKGWRK